MNSRIARFVYKIIDFSRGQETFKVLKGLQSNEELSSSELRDLSWHKLKKYVDFSYKFSPYYKKLLNDIALPASKIRCPEDFQKIPIMSKEDLRKNIHNLEVKDFTGKFTKAKTSGSTGIPLNFYKDNLSFCYSQAAMYRGHGWHGAQIGESEAMLWGIPINFKERAIVKIKDRLLNRFREREYDISGEVFKDFYYMCSDRRPSYLMGYASMIYQFAYFLQEKNIDGGKLNFKFIKFTSEHLHLYQRSLIEDVFKCKVVSEYGAAETGLIAFECLNGNNHLMSDCCYIELINQNKPAEEGKIGRIVVTDFHNFKMPVLRYDIGDTAVYTDKQCQCGSPLPIIESLRGRSSDVVISTDGKPFHSILFYYIMKDFTDKKGGIKQFKVHQKKQNELIVTIVKAESFNEERTIYLGDRIREKLGSDMMIEFNYQDTIKREESGKLRDFVTDLDINEIQKQLY